MSFEFTDERKAFIAARGKVILNACPGSGKTTSVAHKIVELMKTWKETGGVACLSFTNTAKDEIQHKYNELTGEILRYPHFCGTIDSFINKNITLPFAHKLFVGAAPIKYRVIDEHEILEKVFDQNFMNKYSGFSYKYAPYKINYIDKNTVYWDTIDKSADEDFKKYATAAKQYQWKKGILTTNDSIFIATNIIKKFPRLAKFISLRFPHIIVDEAQDTSLQQYEILDALIANGLNNIELIGDPYQCLYEWRNASPTTFISRFDDKENYTGLVFKDNRRSTQPIIDGFQFLRRGSEEKISSKSIVTNGLPIHICKYKDNCKEAVTKYEKLCTDNQLNNSAILVRGATHKRDILGDENKCNPWKSSIPYLLIQARFRIEEKNIKEGVKLMRRLLVSLTTSNYQEIRSKEEEIEDNVETNALLFSALRSIPDFSLTVSDWTFASQEYLKNKFELPFELDFEIKKKGYKEVLLKPMTNYFILEKKSFIPVHTIHHVKGMTFESVALVLGERNHSEILTMKDFEKKDDLPNEKQRMLYVGMSRPEKLLCLIIPDSVNDSDLRKQFGDNIIIN